MRDPHEVQQGPDYRKENRSRPAAEREATPPREGRTDPDRGTGELAEGDVDPDRPLPAPSDAP
jgi:hypothetical protein